MLEDAILDNPDAYGFVARMLHACTLRADLVERLASKIHGREHCKERFLDQYFSLFSRFQPRNERVDWDVHPSPVGGGGESGPGDQGPVVPYAYAF
ncbi:hypothetical protein SERLA73DRAFT_133680 [Serpula lacrymans var. lacrymans S7.3]|uniref:Uncharacterized protein n=2 Tax=Serpula lacrymans var. lacrymans TaxID=341189 RepID=F8PS24_SERL3|nr:uncharacterized protein SERLADRAFT_384643 [Serpula lacrymans var. lacrymans S7.9]EGO00690.1 hypothetical protein SERLA73DRAFT_133680 [Serpula lacrymans var. lacrymans S7.3]EGO26243.1 hypothetical protein SERLADRAFT_384643 [Serpula lacrymans var. lacrymans S7.9]